jgi:hypothetical protein
MSHESDLPAGSPASPDDHGHGPGYEVRDTNVRGVVTFFVGLTLFVILAQVFLWGLLRGLSPERPDNATDAASLGLTPREVQDLRRTIPRQLEDLHKTEDTVLAGSDGRPIDQAMRTLAEKGIPPTAAGLTEADVNSHAGIPASKADATKDKGKEQEKGKEPEKGKEQEKGKEPQDKGKGPEDRKDRTQAKDAPK